MKKLAGIVYGLKMFLLTIHFYFIFSMLHNILDVKPFGYLFLIIYFAYIIKIIIELLSQKKRYKNDLIYNLMQIGVIVYIIVVSINVMSNKMYVTNMTYAYFKTNYIVLIFLFFLIFIYNYLMLYKKK